MVKQAHTFEEYQAAARLFHEYSVWLNIDLSFQNFDKELAAIAEMYAPPMGGVFLFLDNQHYVGCLAVRKIDASTAELKRMYVRDANRKKGIGQQLLDAALHFAQSAGYEWIRLDTLAYMTPAMNLYKKNGFEEIAAYYHNPHDNAVYFEKKITTV